MIKIILNYIECRKEDHEPEQLRRELRKKYIAKRNSAHTERFLKMLGKNKKEAG